MMYKIIKEKFMLLKIFIILAMIVITINYSSFITEGIYGGLLLCTQIVIPSLFPFMIISNMIVKWKAAEFSNKFIDKITKFLFDVNGCCAPIIFLGLIGGYPVGAKGISILYKEKKINRIQAEKLTYILVCGGPGFLITYIGVNTFECKEIGYILLASQILSIFITGFLNKYIFKIYNKNNPKLLENNPTNNKEVNTTPNFSSALILSVEDSVYSMLEMCGFVTLFSAILTALEMLINNTELIKYLSILLEVTTASNYLCNEHNYTLLGFATGFCGLSICFQIFRITKNIKIKKTIFILYRVLQGGITAFFTYAFIKIFNISVPVFSSISNVDFKLSSTIIGSIMLILMGICLLLQCKNININLKTSAKLN